MTPNRLVLAASAVSLLLLACSSAGTSPRPPTPGTGGTSGGDGTGGSPGAGGSPGSVGSGPTGGAPGSPDAAAPAVDASAPPAGSDAGTGPQTPSGTATETVQVEASGAPVTMKTSLDMGQLYLLKATGSVDLGAQKVDAEYVFGSGMPADEMGGIDPGVDVGLLQIDPKVHTTPTPPGPGRMKWSPTQPYREDHVYYLTLTGEGKPLTLKLAKPMGAAAGSGSIAVSLFPLSPMPGGIGDAVDSVDVPFVKMMVMTKPTVAGKQYLLQSSGQGHVSANGLGDSEYMDYDPAGTRFNEGEAGADFGVGIDESDKLGMGRTLPGGYQPRTRWWGTWRMDHTYYMTYTGTGMPIQILYFDSGYGDNRVLTDHITVKIFPAP